MLKALYTIYLKCMYHLWYILESEGKLVNGDEGTIAFRHAVAEWVSETNHQRLSDDITYRVIYNMGVGLKIACGSGIVCIYNIFAFRRMLCLLL